MPRYKNKPKKFQEGFNKNKQNLSNILENHKSMNINNNLLTNQEYFNCTDDNPSKQELCKYITNKDINNEIIIKNI